MRERLSLLLNQEKKRAGFWQPRYKNCNFCVTQDQIRLFKSFKVMKASRRCKIGPLGVSYYIIIISISHLDNVTYKRATRIYFAWASPMHQHQKLKARQFSDILSVVRPICSIGEKSPPSGNLHMTKHEHDATILLPC